MSNCIVQVLDPDPEEAAVIGSALGTRGDVAYDEYGSQALELGVVEVDILFLYEKATVHYVLEYAYIENTSLANPSDIRVVVVERTTLGFKVLLSAEIDAESSYIFKWHVSTPDPLIESQTLTAGPRYIIAPDTETGLTPLISGQDYLEVVFVTEKATAVWSFLVFSIENQVDASPMVFAHTVTVKTELGFKVQLSGAPDSGNYRLRWEVK